MRLVLADSGLCQVMSAGHRATDAGSRRLLGLGWWGRGWSDVCQLGLTVLVSCLRFLYSDEVQIGPETVMTTLYTAKKYAVPALEAHCVEFLKKNLRADNAFMLLTQVRGAGRGEGAGVWSGPGRARARRGRPGWGGVGVWGGGGGEHAKEQGRWDQARTPVGGGARSKD